MVKARTLLLVAAGMMLAAVTLLVWPRPAAADAPGSYGWWNKANASSSFPVSAPAPQAPSDGMYISNGAGGPTAFAALSFTIPPGAALGPMQLKISGNPTVTSPPVACTLTGTFKPAENGAWDQAPKYDCNKAKATASLDSGNTTATFNVDPFEQNGTVAVAILAGGQADQIAFSKPDSNTLVVNGGSAAPADSGATTAPAASGSPADSGSAAPSAAPAAAAPAVSPSPSDSSSLSSSPSALASPAPLPSAAAGSSFTPTQPGPGSGGPIGRPQSGNLTAAGSYSNAAQASLNWRSRVGTTLGLAALLLGLIAWTTGFGLLGGRITPLSVRVLPVRQT